MRAPSVVRVLLAPVAAAFSACATAPSPSETARVSVYQARLDGPPAANRMPSPCSELRGAWFEVVFVSYACPATSLSELPGERSP